jgi:hypothetical protein
MAALYEARPFLFVARAIKPFSEEGFIAPRSQPPSPRLKV